MKKELQPQCKKENAMISVLPQAAGDKAASFCMQVPLCNTKTKALFLPCQDVVRIKKYINDS